MKVDPLNASNPQKAEHHWYPFLRYVKECASKGKKISLNDWLIAQGKVKDYKKEAKRREEEKAKAEATAKEDAKAIEDARS